MRKKVINVDDGSRPCRFYRRFSLNALAIMAVDALVISLSLAVANVILLWVRDVPFAISKGLLILPAWALVSAVARLLPGWGMGAVDELRRIQGALFILFAIEELVAFFSQITLASSRIVFLLTYAFAAVLIPLMRASTRGWLIRMGWWGVPVAIYGEVESASAVIDALQEDPGLGYVPFAVFTDDLPAGRQVKGLPVLGGLFNTTCRTPVGLVALQASRHRLIETLEGPLEVYRRVILIPDLKEAPSLWVVPRDIQGILGLEITKNLLNPISRILKRFTDLVLVILSAPLWGPLMGLISLVIWLEDRENPFFFQPRVGRGGGMFRTAKFRTMVPDAENVLQQALENDPVLRKDWETNFKLKIDPRITKVGHFLRKTSLDEIPQLLNVLRGTMSLVGPRPLPSYHFDDLPEPVRFLRHKVRPGITGLWQVSGRSEAGTEGMERWDPYYVRNWSIWLDIVILFRTFKAVFNARGAY